MVLSIFNYKLNYTLCTKLQYLKVAKISPFAQEKCLYELPSHNFCAFLLQAYTSLPNENSPIYLHRMQHP
jgi:hypothetical protein